jgi:hypothetical protein
MHSLRSYKYYVSSSSIVILVHISVSQLNPRQHYEYLQNFHEMELFHLLLYVLILGSVHASLPYHLSDSGESMMALELDQQLILTQTTTL